MSGERCLLDRISGLEKVEVSDAEVDEEISRMADYYKASVDEVRDSIEKQDGLENIRHNLKTRKTIEAIMAKAKITDGPWVMRMRLSGTGEQNRKRQKEGAG
jgi:FKBP-type peptidyl-prolyl cis-trans isomerase (trigger factor)